MKIKTNTEYRFTFEEISEYLKNKLYDNEKLHISSLDDLAVTHNGDGNFTVIHYSESEI